MMIRTTIRLDEDIFKDARKKAIDQRLAFTEFVNDALAEYLGKQRKMKKNKGTEFLEGLIKLGKKHPVKGPKDLAKNLDKYLWDEYRHN